MTSSRDGRRVIVAPVTGEVGDRLQKWRERHDPEQARRLPPHTTILYWANIDTADEAALSAQIAHAFPHAIDVTLGTVHTFANADSTYYVDVSQTDALNEARTRLFDRSRLTLPEQRQEWDWHVTVVRYGIRHDPAALAPYLPELTLNSTWHIDRLLWLELRDGIYHEVGRWELD